MNRKHLIALACAVGVTAIAIPTALAGGNGKTVCPSGGTPAAGSTVKGGLEVDGTCILSNVTVYGGLTVDATGRLSFQGGTVNGGITVNPGGELDLNATTNGSGAPTGTTATINGGVTINNGLDADLWTSTIHGPLTVTGIHSGYAPVFCGNTVTGPASLSNLGNYATIGYPAIGCPGNTFNSLSLANSTVFIGGNTINHDLLCTNTTIFVVAPNTIGGTNTCY